jgi:hypothetical protein
VRTVEQPQLALFERRDVVDEHRTGLLPARPTAGEVPAEHPLGERLGGHRARVVHAELPAYDVGGVGGRVRGDAVDHGRDERDRAGDPLRQIRFDALGHLGHDRLDGRAVAGEVVAGHHGDRARVGTTAFPQTGDESARNGDRRL